MTDLQRAIKWLEFMQESGYETEAEQQHCRVLLDALRWVPVSERLPTLADSFQTRHPHDNAIVVLINGFSAYREVDIACRQTWDVETKEYCEDRNITHWMPLPKPPESEG